MPRVQGTITLQQGGRERTINVRVTTEQARETEHGYVVTFDDITDLVAAQRTPPGRDVARRIAHEIKNPLTPIQLSAERLRRKYRKTLAEERETFDRCTDTIVRQVGDIGRMVDEFSAFARMPAPEVEAQDLGGAGARRRCSPAGRPARHHLRRRAAEAARCRRASTAG